MYVTAVTVQLQYVYYSSVLQYSTPAHETGHALGLHHVQTREDRDDHVTIMFDNIDAGKEGNFDKLSEYNYPWHDIPYNYASVMHYGRSVSCSDRTP